VRLGLTDDGTHVGEEKVWEDPADPGMLMKIQQLSEEMQASNWPSPKISLLKAMDLARDEVG
jgi:hypothetical protein